MSQWEAAFSGFNFFFDLTPSDVNVPVAWVAVGYVNSTPYHADDAIIILHRMPWSMVSFFIKPPPLALHLSPPKWGSHFTTAENLLREDPLVLIFSRDDNRTMTQARLLMHHCSRDICLLQVQHLLLNICSRKLFLLCCRRFPTNICWFGLAARS